jgi:hypothetical protein
MGVIGRRASPDRYSFWPPKKPSKAIAIAPAIASPTKPAALVGRPVMHEDVCCGHRGNHQDRKRRLLPSLQASLSKHNTTPSASRSRSQLGASRIPWLLARMADRKSGTFPLRGMGEKPAAFNCWRNPAVPGLIIVPPRDGDERRRTPPCCVHLRPRTTWPGAMHSRHPGASSRTSTARPCVRAARSC